MPSPIPSKLTHSVVRRPHLVDTKSAGEFYLSDLSAVQGVGRMDPSMCNFHLLDKPHKQVECWIEIFGHWKTWTRKTHIQKNQAVPRRFSVERFLGVWSHKCFSSTENSEQKSFLTASCSKYDHGVGSDMCQVFRFSENWGAQTAL